MTDRSLFDGTSTDVPWADGGTEGFGNQYKRHMKSFLDASTFPLTSVAGTANAVTAVLDPVLDGSGLVGGMMFTITWAGSNTVTGVTLEINGSGSPVPVKRADGSSLGLGELYSGLTSLIAVVGTEFRILSQTRVGPQGAPDAVLEHQEASGVAAGNATSGSFQTRTLNTEVRDLPGMVTLASNEFTVDRACWCDFEFRLFRTDDSIGRIYNVTDGVVGFYGMGGHSNGGGAYAEAVLRGGGPLLAGKTYRLEHRVTTTSNTNGMGRPTSFGTEIYSRIQLWRT